jgi:hypothetical protein
MFSRTVNKCVRHKFNSAMIFFCCCVIGLLHLSVSAVIDELPRADKLLPPETILLVNIDNFQQLKTQCEKTILYKFYKDPAMVAFVDNAKTKWREKVLKMDDNNVFKAIFNTDIWPQGKMAVAFVLNQQSKDFNDVPLVMITQWGEGIDKIKEAVDKMLKKNIELGGHRKKSEEYRGVSIEEIVDEASSELNHCFIGDYFIAADNLDLLKFVIAHIKGSAGPTLADDTDYVAAMKTVGPYHDIDFYVNIKQIIKTTLAEDSDGTAHQKTANLGFDNIAAFGCSITVGRSSGSSVSAKAFLKINGAKKGICKMLDMESASFKTPPFIPVTTYSVTFFNLNIKKAYDELYNIAYSFNPQYAAMMQAVDLPDSPEGEPGLKLKTDIIGHLGSQILISQNVNKPFSNSSVPTESLIALAVNDRSALEKSLSVLHSKMIASNKPDARRELLGYTIYLLGPSTLPFLRPGLTPMQLSSESNTPQVPALAFTVTDTHLIFASEQVVERAIRALNSADSPSLSSAKWFTSAKSAIPSVVGMAVLEDNAASSEIFWWMIKQSSKAGSSTALAGPTAIKLAPGGISELVNFDLLPPFDAVRKYFGQSTFYGISTPEGFLFEFKSISPVEPPG